MRSNIFSEIKIKVKSCKNINYIPLKNKMSKPTDVDIYIFQLDNILKEHGINDVRKSIRI